MFTKYKKQTANTKVLLLYLLLNGFNVKNIEWIEEAEESRKFGLKVKKVYGVTSDFVNIKDIEQEIELIQSPIICSPLSYEYYSDARIIYTYERDEENEDIPLWINDMNIISNIMIISENSVVSSNLAKPLEECINKGFMYFYDYVLKDECVINKWRISYKDKVFSIYYASESDEGLEEILLFSAIEIDKTSTYKTVIYVVLKASLQIEEWLPDNYSVQTYEMVVNKQ